MFHTENLKTRSDFKTKKWLPFHWKLLLTGGWRYLPMNKQVYRDMFFKILRIKVTIHFDLKPALDLYIKKTQIWKETTLRNDLVALWWFFHSVENRGRLSRRLFGRHTGPLQREPGPGSRNRRGRPPNSRLNILLESGGERRTTGWFYRSFADGPERRGAMLLFLLLLYCWFCSGGLEFSRRSPWGFCCFKEEQIRRKKIFEVRKKQEKKKLNR